MSPQLDELRLASSAQVSGMLISQWMAEAIRAGAELGIGDALADGPLTSAEVADRLVTDPDYTHRLLLALVPLELVEQVGDRFQLTDRGHCLASDSPTTIKAWVRLMGSGMAGKSWSSLGECVRTGQMASKVDASRPDTDTALWDEMQDDPEAAEIFHRAMMEITRDSAPPVVAGLDLDADRRVVDVGGGAGGLLCAVLEANPHLEGIAFDLGNARPTAEKVFAERGLADRASFVAGSFFDDPLPDADVYLMKNVIHDWDDEHAARILDNCRRTMAEGSRLMLVEAPLGEERSTTLLDWFMSFADLNVMVNNGGRERTEAEYRELVSAAGLQVAGVRDTGLFSIFEITA
jgi:precorrin-6B methylase 2